MRTIQGCGLALMLAGLVGGTALAGGYSASSNMGTNGVVALMNAQSNSVWKPVAVSLKFGNANTRLVTISRVLATGRSYKVSSKQSSATEYLYEFNANYWTGYGQGWRVSVSPAATGLVEVIYE